MLSMRSQMYNVLDIPKMTKVKNPHTRKRTKPLNGYHSTILLKAGSKLDLLPPGSLVVRNQDGEWEAHLPIKNKEIVKKLAKALDAIAFL